ncbi:hypothetical protein T05_9460 [Trichinella murrelli]|uniref:Uncharacterized protein n=1 Tax=Trichinella murrelli TaxID=144512 RepID=A0A0V0SNX2_9BILA|nr:hypothetical protein T05_9460 [Trichinella murrelli]
MPSVLLHNQHTLKNSTSFFSYQGEPFQGGLSSLNASWHR